MKLRKRINDRQWQKTMNQLITILCIAIIEDGDKKAEELLEAVQPNGHQIAAWERYQRRNGPLALLNPCISV